MTESNNFYNSLYVRSTQDSEQAVREEQFWKTTVLEVDCASSLERDEPLTKLNVVNTFVHRIIYPGRNESIERFWLPAKFCVNNPKFRREELLSHFSMPATKAGFALRIKGWDHSRNSMRLICGRGRQYRPDSRTKSKVEVVEGGNSKGQQIQVRSSSPLKKKKKTKVHTTVKPINSCELCPFSSMYTGTPVLNGGGCHLNRPEMQIT